MASIYKILKEQFKSDFNNAVSNVTDCISKLDAMSVVTTAVGANIVLKASETFDSVKEASNDLMEGAKSVGSDLADGLKEFGKDAINVVQNVANEVSEIQNVSTQICDGVIKGQLSPTDAIAASAAFTAHKTGNAIKNLKDFGDTIVTSNCKPQSTFTYLDPIFNIIDDFSLPQEEQLARWHKYSTERKKFLATQGVYSKIHREAALIASHVYGNCSDSVLEGGWRVSSPSCNIVLEDHISGLVSGFYERFVEEKYQYIYAIAGTDPTSVQDWVTNIGQLFGKGGQHIIALENAKKLVNYYGNEDLIFVGHSLGGGVAALCSMMTNARAITFNAAGISTPTKLELGVNNEDEIEAFVMDGDPLDLLQRSGDGICLVPANGNVFPIYPRTLKAFANRHGITSIIESLETNQLMDL